MEATSVPRGRALLLPRRLLAALDDERLVEQLRRGNAAAFEVIYDRHHRGILAYCRHLLGSREEAEDVLQHTFVAAHEGIVAGEREIKLKAWLYTIARNRCLSVLRARREYPAELDARESAGLAEEVQQRADLRELLADLHELPEPQRAALVLMEAADLSHAEIAQVLECDVAKVKSLVFQARSGLIERRQARETPCEEIREQLATLRGGALRRGPLRRHLKACPGCTAYREEIRRQRQMLALALPVIPSVGLRESALAAVGLGGTGTAAALGGGAAAGGAAAGGALAGGGGAASSGGLGAAMGALAAKVGVAKVAVAVVAGSAAVGGGTVAITQTADAPRGAPVERQTDEAPGSSEAAPGGGGSGAVVPGAVDERGQDGADAREPEAAEQRRERRRRDVDDLTAEQRGERDRDVARSRDRRRDVEDATPGRGTDRSSERREQAQRRRRAQARRRSGAAPRPESRETPRPLRTPRPQRMPQPAPGSPPEPAPETAPDPLSEAQTDVGR
jgi:RNA polymerase sigma factor (sigma-70 family)